MKKIVLIILVLAIIGTLVTQIVLDNKALGKQQALSAHREQEFVEYSFDASNRLWIAYEVIVRQQNVITQQSWVIEIQRNIIEAHNEKTFRKSFALVK
jgi:hypothetical protein